MRVESFLFPKLEPYKTGRLALDELHEMYWEESGNPHGVPVLVLHGGPGAGSSPMQRRFFDPDFCRVIAFDQRGAGRSTPWAETRLNTTDHLLSDIERLRELRGIARWFLFGGSWGSTLALAYAQAHPQRCLGLVLRGVFLGERHEIEWLLYGLERISPDAWREFVSLLADSERGDILSAYRRRLSDPDPETHLPAAAAWTRYEAVNSTLMPNKVIISELQAEALALARIEAHYFSNDCFLRPGQLLAAAGSIGNIRCIIVQGKYDLLSPIRSAHQLHEALGSSTLRIVLNAGHSAFEPAIARELIAACVSLMSNK